MAGHWALAPWQAPTHPHVAAAQIGQWAPLPSRAVSRILAASQWWVAQIAPRVSKTAESILAVTLNLAVAYYT